MFGHNKGSAFMWVFMNDSIVSVAMEKGSDRLVVRSRVDGDIQRAIPGVKVTEITGAHKFEARITREEWKAALSEMVDRVDYLDFAEAVDNRLRYAAYKCVFDDLGTIYEGYAKDYPPDTVPMSVLLRATMSDPSARAFLLDDYSRCPEITQEDLDNDLTED